MPPAHPLPQLAGTYYCRVVGQADNRPVSNIFTFFRSSRPTPDPDDFAAANLLALTIAAQWPTIASDGLHTTYTGNEVQVYALNRPLDPAHSVPLVAPGGRVGSQSYLQVAGRIQHQVFRRGKGSQSGTSLSPLSADDITVNGDQVTAGWVSRMQTDFPTFITNVKSTMQATYPGPWSYVQLSKQTFGGVYGRTFEITQSTAETLISSAKRRLGR